MFVIPLFMLLAPVGAIGFFGYLGLRFVRAREREAQGGRDPSGHRNLTRLEEQVHALQTEVEHLRDRVDFTERLLEPPRNRPAAD